MFEKRYCSHYIVFQKYPTKRILYFYHTHYPSFYLIDYTKYYNRKEFNIYLYSISTFTYITRERPHIVTSINVRAYDLTVLHCVGFFVPYYLYRSHQHIIMSIIARAYSIDIDAHAYDLTILHCVGLFAP